MVAEFNWFETHVGNSELLGAQTSPLWVRSAVGTAANLLGFIAKYYDAILPLTGEVGLSPSDSIPDPFSFASLQSIVMRHEASFASQLRSRFTTLGLPTRGFDQEPLPSHGQGSVSLSHRISADAEEVKAQGLSSEDAKQILTTPVVRTSAGSVRGGVSGGDLNRVTEMLALPAKNSDQHKEGFLKSNWNDFKNRGISQVLVKCLATGLVLLIGVGWAWMRSGGEEKPKSPSPSVQQQTNEALRLTTEKKGGQAKTGK